MKNLPIAGLCFILLLVPVLRLKGQQVRVKTQAPQGMVLVPGGTYKPFIQPGGQVVKVRCFYLDIHAVTNAEFLAFVKANPAWARSKVSRLYADASYLREWEGDYLTGAKVLSDAPVTGISWFAARAYCQWKGKRLPTMDEWEYAAGAAPAGANNGRALSAIILDWYSRPNPPVLPAVESTFRNRFGLFDMHGLVWEWVYDFNSVIAASSGGGQNFFCAAASLNTPDKEDYAAYMRYAFRESLKGSSCVANLGFRCAMDASAGKR